MTLICKCSLRKNVLVQYNCQVFSLLIIKLDANRAQTNLVFFSAAFEAAFDTMSQLFLNNDYRLIY